MEVQLTPDQEAFVRQGIDRGDYRDFADAIQAALHSWVEGERARAEIRAALEEGEADVAAGRYRDYTGETLSQLAGEIASEARRDS